MTPEVIAGLAIAGVILLGVCVWLSVRHYRKRKSQPTDIIVKGVISEDDEKVIPPKCVSHCVPFVENDR